MREGNCAYCLPSNVIHFKCLLKILLVDECCHLYATRRVRRMVDMKQPSHTPLFDILQKELQPRPIKPINDEIMVGRSHVVNGNIYLII